MLHEWKGRPPEVASLLNPAFCSTLILHSVNEFDRRTYEGFSYVYPFIMLPLVLHRQTRLKFPRSIRTTFLSWVTREENASIKIGFAERAKYLVPHVRESLLFAIHHDCLEVTERGLFLPKRSLTFPAKKATDEVKECLKTSRICAKWFAEFNDLKMAMIFLGVKP